MNKFSYLLIPFCILFFPGCEDDFIEDDLTGKLVSILAPADNDTVPTSTPLFWWNEINGARSYRVQIVYPDFMSPQQLLYDSAVASDRFYPSLTPGNSYEWRIRPENGSSEGEWVTRRLTIDSSISLSNQTIVITQPATNGTSTANSTMSFTWSALTSASLYRLEITNTVSGIVSVSTTSAMNNFTTVLAQGSYEFRVRAENATSITAWATRTFIIDQTAPTTPVLIFPGDNAFYASPPSSINFDWNNSADAYTDSLEIATDSTFSSGIVLQVLLSSTQSSYTWTGAQTLNTYYWRVRSTDLAGNRSSYSNVFSFIVN